MEDAITVAPLRIPHLARPASSDGTFFGLYDGHGGAGCAIYVAEHLHRQLLSSEALQRGEVCAALLDAFAATESTFFEECESGSGACALAAVLVGDMLHVAHCGDSRAVLCTGPHSKAVRLTTDHKPDEPSEQRRIESIGGSVLVRGRCARVTHSNTSMMLATSRSFGDRGFKESWEAVAAQEAMEAALDAGNADELDQAEASDAAGAAPIPPLLSAVPTTLARRVSAEDKFLILACDGVWDVLTDQDACDSVRSALEQPGAEPEAAARKLVGDAYRAGSEDNISALVAVLHHDLR